MANDLFAPPSPEELKKITTPAAAEKDLFAPPSPDELKTINPPQEASFGLLGTLGGMAKDLAGKALDKVDSYTGAPGRMFAGGLLAHKSIPESFQAAKNQFGADTALAPTSHEISEKLGLPQIDVKKALMKSHLGAAKVGGALLNKDNPANISLTDAAVATATDPTSYIPVGLLGKTLRTVGGGVKEAAISGKGLLTGKSVGKNITEAATKSVPKLHSLEELQKMGTNIPMEHLGPDTAEILGIPWEEKGYNYRLDGNAPNVKYFLDDKGQVIGHLALDDEDSIKAAYVNENVQNKGIGTEMYRRLFNEGIPVKSDEFMAMEPQAKAIWKKLSSEYPIAKEGDRFVFTPKSGQTGDLVRDTIKTNLPPQTFEEIAKKVEDSKAKGMSTDLGSKKEVERVENTLSDLEHKILPAQKAAYNDKNSYDILKTFRELPSPEAKALTDYEMLQKGEAAKKLNDEVTKLHPDPAPDITTAGERASKVALDRYNEMRDAAGEVFDKFHGVSVNPEEHMAQLTDRIGNAVPALKPYIKIEPGGMGGLPGKATLLPYNSKMGISQNAYNLLGKVIADLNDGRATVPEMQAQREFLRNGVDPLSKDAVTVNRVRKAMLDHIQDVIESKAPELKGVVRPTFKHYAINEQRLDEMEKTLGGSLNDHASFTKAVKPERVVERIFSNTNSVKLAKETFGKEEFNKVLGDYLNHLVRKASDKGSLSSQKLSSLLKSNDPVLREAFKENPQALTRLQSLTDFMRLVPDAPTPNPSGSGKTIFNLNRMTGLLTHPVSTATDVVKDVAHGISEGRETKKTLDQVKGLMGQKPKPKANRTSTLINATRAGLINQRLQPKEQNQ